jgi:hypothetical protein
VTTAGTETQVKNILSEIEAAIEVHSKHVPHERGEPEEILLEPGTINSSLVAGESMKGYSAHKPIGKGLHQSRPIGFTYMLHHLDDGSKLLIPYPDPEVDFSAFSAGFLQRSRALRATYAVDFAHQPNYEPEELQVSLDPGEEPERPLSPVRPPSPGPDDETQEIIPPSDDPITPITYDFDRKPVDHEPEELGDPNLRYIYDPEEVRKLEPIDFNVLGLSEVAEDGAEDGDQADCETASFEKLQAMLNHEDFQREDVLPAYDELGIHPDQPEKTLPLMKDAVLQKHQVVGVQWMLQMENGLAKGGLLADDCGTGKTLTTLATICYQLDGYEKMIASTRPPKWDQYEADKSKWEARGSKGKGPTPPSWPPKRPTLILCPPSMISQWKEDVIRFTHLSPFVHFGKGTLDRITYMNIMRGEKPWRHVIITTPDTLRTRWSPRNAGQTQFWGPGLIDRIVVDEFHRLRLAGLGPGIFTNTQTGGLLEISQESYAEQICRMILTLNPTYRWALSATPMVSSVSDCRWILRFLQRRTWVEENVPPDTFALQSDLESGAWTKGAPNVPGHHPEATFTPVANPYGMSREHKDTMVHCTTIAWDMFVAAHMSRYGALARRKAGHGQPLSEQETLEMDTLLDKCLQHARCALVSITLRRTMSSRIPFRTGRPIIDIPPMTVTGQRIRWVLDTPEQESLESRRFFRMILTEPYSNLAKLLIGRELVALTATFRWRWRLICLASLSPLLAVAAFGFHETVPMGKTQRGPNKDDKMKGKEDPFAAAAPVLGRFKSKTLWALPNGKVDHGKPDLDRLRELCAVFRQAFPQWATDYIPANERILKNMDPDGLEQVLRWGAPKLAWLRDHLKKTLPGDKREERSKLVIWCYYPQSQWLVEQYCRLLRFRCAAIHSSMASKDRDRLRHEFNNEGGISILVLCYGSSSEGLNLQSRCSNTILLEQGSDYTNEHQAWSRVRRIGQPTPQETLRIINPETVNTLAEHAQKLKKTALTHAEALFKTGRFNPLPYDMDKKPLWEPLVNNVERVMLTDFVLGGEDDNKQEAVVKEAVVEEPVVEEPVVKEAVVKEPVVKEPVVEEPVVGEAVVKEPVVGEPVVEEPVMEEPVVKEAVVKEPVVEEPVVKEAVVEEPVVEEPVVEEPVVEEAVVKETTVKEAAVTEAEDLKQDMEALTPPTE